MSQGATQMRFTLEVPDGYVFDDYVCGLWWNYLDAILNRIDRGVPLRFQCERQEAGDAEWTLCETEASHAIDGDSIK